MPPGPSAQDGQPWPSTPEALRKHRSRCHRSLESPGTAHSPGCAFLLRGRWRAAASSAPASASEPASPGGTNLGGREAVRGQLRSPPGSRCRARAARTAQAPALARSPRAPAAGSGSGRSNSPHLALQQHSLAPVPSHQAPRGQGLPHSSRPAAGSPDPSTLFGKICPGKYKPKVLETSSRRCSTAGSCDLILFLIFFFFFFFMPCPGWRNTKFQAPQPGKGAAVCPGCQES